MDSMQRLTQAYSQAPWRKQLQMVGTILLFVVAVAIVALIYLNVTTRAAATGREIQSMQVRVSGYHNLGSDPNATPAPIEELEQRISSLEAQLGYLTSYKVLAARAEDLGLKQVAPEDMLYLEVPGYIAEKPATKAPPAVPVVVSASGLSPAFKESLVEWLKGQVFLVSRLFKEVQP